VLCKSEGVEINGPVQGPVGIRCRLLAAPFCEVVEFNILKVVIFV
jgi:hypothetical protein